jgi:hypothetical protein
MYFQYTREKGDDYIRFLLEQQFTPQNIYNKTEIKLNSVEVYEEIREIGIVEDEDNNINGINDDIKLVSKLSPKEIENYVNSLKAAAVHWYNTFNPLDENTTLTDNERLWIDRLNRIGIVYFRPLITVSFLSENITEQQRIELFKAIERFIFITFRLSRAFSTYRNSEFYRAARQLRKGELTIETIIQRLDERMDYCFNKDENTNNKYFNYTYFQTFLDKKFKQGGGYYYWNGLRYFLYEYEMEKVSEWGNQKIDWNLFVKGEKDKISIEHIYPQTAINKCWDKEFNKYSEREKNIFKGTLGNLLPLSQSINSSLQNDCFNDKKNPKLNDRDIKIRQGYSDGSHSEIEVSKYKAWTPKTILERGKKLLDFMERRWNIEFENEEAKIDLLFLNFMVKDNDKTNE